MGKIRWGLLSTAHINQRLIPAIRSSPGSELAAIASRNPSTARAYASEWQIPRWFGSYQGMLDSGEIDVAYIGLPNHLHAEWSIRAMQAGVHVLCEKPFALSLEDVDAMISASLSTGRRLAEAFMYRHHPQTRIAGDWVRSGRLGEITVIKSDFHFRLEESQNIRLNPAMGGGSLWDVGIYPVSLAQYLLGSPPVRVAGMQWIGASGIDEVFSGLLHYPAGQIAAISCSFRTPYFTRAEILGTLGSLSMNRPFTSPQEAERRMIFTPASGEPVEVPIPSFELYSGEVEDMNTAILDGTPNYVTLEETRNHVDTVLRLYESATEHKLR